MTISKAIITVVDPDSPEGKAMLERMKREVEEGKARVRKHGGTSFEGFYTDEDGEPHSIGEDD